jgi:hypothetical protein
MNRSNLIGCLGVLGVVLAVMPSCKPAARPSPTSQPASAPGDSGQELSEGGLQFNSKLALSVSLYDKDGERQGLKDWSGPVAEYRRLLKSLEKIATTAPGKNDA